MDRKPFITGQHVHWSNGVDGFWMHFELVAFYGKSQGSERRGSGPLFIVCDEDKVKPNSHLSALMTWKLLTFFHRNVRAQHFSNYITSKYFLLCRRFCCLWPIISHSMCFDLIQRSSSSSLWCEMAKYHKIKLKASSVQKSTFTLRVLF